MTTSDLTSNPLPQLRVEVVEAGKSATPHWTPCELGRHIVFDTAGLEAYSSQEWDHRVYDAFVIAGAVEFCDRAKRRGSQQWGRDISVRIRVHDPDVWKGGGLDEVLVALTCDRWVVEFVKRETKAARPRQLLLDIDGSANVVVPFSDGLDSYAVARLLEQDCGSVLRIRLGSKSHVGATKNSRRPFATIPYQVKCDCNAENSMRSRGFKFALLSGVAAYLAQVNDIAMPESGQGMLGSTLVPVGIEYEDVRNHPRFLDKMESFLSTVFNHDIRFQFPRMWHTKADTLKELFEMDAADTGWQSTRSCWQDQRQASVAGKLRQCGICGNCLLRRMSLYVADRDECRKAYVWEDLTAKQFELGLASDFKKHNMKAMHGHALRAALDLEYLSELSFSSLQDVSAVHIAELEKSLQMTESEVVNHTDSLIQKHAAEWRAFKSHLGRDSFIVRWLE